MILRLSSGLTRLFGILLLIIFPLALALAVLGLYGWDLSIPLIYRDSDDIWQLTLTKMLSDTGWVLTNPYLGAPDVAHWHHNAAAQTSALHSVLMLVLSSIIGDPIRLQQTYYLINFPLICITSFIACRLLGVWRLPAFCVGILFAFTTYRIDEMLYAFLTNYFMVPLVMVPVIWILSGRFATFFKEKESHKNSWKNLIFALKSRDFFLSSLFIGLAAASDGYYGFFTLLLLGFVVFIRCLLGDWRRPLSLAPGLLCIAILLLVALLLQLPLHNYKKANLNEFYPNGVQDPTLVKHSFEAEVYSSTLKMMIAPIQHHRIKMLGELGKTMVQSSDGARLYKNGRTLVPLGTLCSLLLLAAFALLATPGLRGYIHAIPDAPRRAFEDSILGLVFFIFLCSILGGVGTLVALIFPTIRGYDRFPLFLIFLLYFGAAWAISRKLEIANASKRNVLMCLTLLITVTALYDQIPKNAHKGDTQSKAQFLAERKFVQNLEKILPPNAMVYQYPYSQYLRLNKYYGWGSFSHIRLYLHSQQLRWSNGGAKNSPADDWNYRISQFPLNDLITEIESVGFASLVIDRKILPVSEYQNVRNTLTNLGYTVHEDAPSKLSYIQLQDPGFRVVYDSNYRNADHILVTDRARLTNRSLPKVIGAEELRSALAAASAVSGTTITKHDYPNVFLDGKTIMRGLGLEPITPFSDMKGELNCSLPSKIDPATSADTITLKLRNNTQFDWSLDEGAFPLKIGVHLYDQAENLLSFDDGYRLATRGYIRHGDELEFHVNLKSIPPVETWKPAYIEFAVVQDGNAWFDTLKCRVLLKD